MYFKLSEIKAFLQNNGFSVLEKQENNTYNAEFGGVKFNIAIGDYIKLSIVVNNKVIVLNNLYNNFALKTNIEQFIMKMPAIIEGIKECQLYGITLISVYKKTVIEDNKFIHECVFNASVFGIEKIYYCIRKNEFFFYNKFNGDKIYLEKISPLHILKAIEKQSKIALDIELEKEKLINDIKNQENDNLLSFILQNLDIIKKLA